MSVCLIPGRPLGGWDEREVGTHLRGQASTLFLLGHRPCMGGCENACEGGVRVVCGWCVGGVRVVCVWCGWREGGGGWYVCDVCGVKVVCGWRVGGVWLTSSSSLLYRAMSLRKVRTMMRAKIPKE